jgi:hypothetical protein
MLFYKNVRKDMRSGDILLVKNRGILSILIRMFTAESFNHVAFILGDADEPSGLWVSEMREGKGHQAMPASQWMNMNATSTSFVFWGKAPPQIRGSECIEEHMQQARIDKSKYSYLSLISVFISQVFRVKTLSGKVCSTYGQKLYGSCGYDMGIKRTADPGDFFEVGSDFNRIVP